MSEEDQKEEKEEGKRKKRAPLTRAQKDEKNKRAREKAAKVKAEKEKAERKALRAAKAAARAAKAEGLLPTPKKTKKVEKVEKVEEAPPPPPTYAYRIFSSVYNSEANEYQLHSRSIPPPLALFYPKGRRTYAEKHLWAKGYGILIFQTPEEAFSFGGGEVWKVECGEIKEAPKKRIGRGEAYNLPASNGDATWESIAEILDTKASRSYKAFWNGTKVTEWVRPVVKMKKEWRLDREGSYDGKYVIEEVAEG